MLLRSSLVIVLAASPVIAVAEEATAPPPTATSATGESEGRACFSMAPYQPAGGDAHAELDAVASARAHHDRAAGFAALTVSGGARQWLGGADCPHTIGIGVSATPRWEGPGVGAGVDTSATLAFGPARHLDPDMGVIAWAPTTWELTYAGDLGVRPGLADRNDVARDLFDRFAVGAASRMFRVEFADLCKPDDQRETCREGRGPREPTPMTIDVGAFEGSLGFTEQGERRLEQRVTVALLRVSAAEVDGMPVDALADILRVDSETVDVGGVVGHIDIVWPVYFHTTNPHTGTRYVVGYGFVTGFKLQDGERPRSQDHTDRAVGGIGASTGGSLRGAAGGWNRTAYVTMAAEPVLEDRLTAEGWTAFRGVGLRARAFASRLERLEPAMAQPQVVWTGGVDVTGSRRLRGFDVDLSVEAGRSYYAVLDGAAAEASFGARAQLTIHRTARAVWER